MDGEGVEIPGRGSTDRLVQYLTTLVSHPYVYLVVRNSVQSGKAAQQERGKARLSDFPEGRAIATLERWCRQPAYVSLIAELLHKYAQLLRAIILQNIEWESLRGLLLRPRLVRAAAVPPDYTLDEVTAQQLREAAPGGDLLRGIERAVAPNLVAIRDTLEHKAALSRGRTTLELMDVAADLARFYVRLFFASLRAGAKVLAYFKHVLDIFSGALSFTIVLGIALGFISAWFAFASLWLYTAADFAEPFLYQGLSWVKLGVEKLYGVVDRRFNYGALVGPRRLPAGNFEALEEFFDEQLQHPSNLINRPEIPQLANDSLLVKCYDLGLINAQGDVLSKVFQHLLSHPPGPFLPNGFFGVASTRHYRAAMVMLARLLCWKRISLVVNGPEAIRYIVISGADARAASALYSRLLGRAWDAAGGGGDNSSSRGGSSSGGAAAAEVGAVHGERTLYCVYLPEVQQGEPEGATQTICGLAACTVVCASLAGEPNPLDLDVILANIRGRRLVLLVLSGPAGEAPPQGWTQEALVSAVEAARVRWQGYVDDLSLEHSLDSSFCTVMAADVEQDRRWPTGAGPGGAVMQGFDQVKDWIMKGAHGYRRAG